MARDTLPSLYDWSLSIGNGAGAPGSVHVSPLGTVDDRVFLRATGLAPGGVSPYNKAMAMAPIESDTTDPLLSAVGRRVQHLREAKGLKPGEFAKLAGVTQQYLWRLEDGQQNLNLRSISRLAIALDVPMTALLEGIDPDPSTVKKRAYRKARGT